MGAILVVARAAWVELFRRLGLWVYAPGLVVLALAAQLADARDNLVPLFWVGVAAVPALSGTGMRRLTQGGPLALAGRAGQNYFTLVGYGLGTALFAFPLLAGLMLLLAWNPQPVVVGELFLLVLALAWVGAVAGRRRATALGAFCAALLALLGLGLLDFGGTYALLDALPREYGIRASNAWSYLALLNAWVVVHFWMLLAAGARLRLRD